MDTLSDMQSATRPCSTEQHHVLDRFHGPSFAEPSNNFGSFI